MNKKSIRSLSLTFLCAAIILGLGYGGIVEGGKRLLNSEKEPEKVSFENTGSHIFYGKIEEDIQLFPWSYYDEEHLVSAVNYTEWRKYGNAELLEKTLREMIAYCCEADIREIDTLYRQKQYTIIDEIKACETDYGGMFFFYQDRIEVENRQYQVKAAFSTNEVISFSCIEYRQEDVRKEPEWEAGKKALVNMLEKYRDQIGGNVYDMAYPYGNYSDEEMGAAYAEAYIMNMENLRILMEDNAKKNEAYLSEQEVKGKVSYVKEKGDYSYQVIELKDMILLLIQGPYNMGIFYDPVKQVFCGYNYFWES